MAGHTTREVNYRYLPFACRRGINPSRGVAGHHNGPLTARLTHAPSRKSDRKTAGPKRRSHSHPNTYIRMERGEMPPKPNNATKKADARSDRNPTDARPSITLGLSYGKQTILPIIHHANNE